jgi:hypothetical protein
MRLAAAPDRPDTRSDLQQPAGEETTPQKASRQILRHEIEQGLDALEYGLARPEAQTAERDTDGVLTG